MRLLWLAVLPVALATPLFMIPNNLAEPNDQWPMKLQMLDAASTAAGAVCLDGTPAGFYFAPARNPAMKNNWQLYFQGGGWCYDEMDCLGRSKTGLGSSKSWGNTSSMGGLMSSDCAVNPDFCEWNRVHMVYCDGNSFSGNRDEPVVVNGTKLYFRGRRIVDEIFKTLFAMGMHNAEQVLQTGCSAGGLATYLHADYVGDLLRAGAPALKTYKAASISGFFLMHETVENKPVYPNEMKTIFALANSTHGLNSKCIASKSSDQQWECNFAQESYKFIETPFMVLNSALDSWQTNCILTAEPVQPSSESNGNCSAAPGWEDCSKDPAKCTPHQMPAMITYETDFLFALNGSSTFTKPGNGAFVYSCHTHCAAQSSAFNTFKIGGVSMQQAVSKWWASSAEEDAASNTYLPCLYHTTAPVQCNPTC